MSSTMRTRIWSAMILVCGAMVAGRPASAAGAGRLQVLVAPDRLLRGEEGRRKDQVLVDEGLEDDAVRLLQRRHDDDRVPARVQDRGAVRVYLDVVLGRAEDERDVVAGRGVRVQLGVADDLGLVGRDSHEDHLGLAVEAGRRLLAAPARLARGCGRGRRLGGRRRSRWQQGTDDQGVLDDKLNGPLLPTHRDDLAGVYLAGDDGRDLERDDDVDVIAVLDPVSYTHLRAHETRH